MKPKGTRLRSAVGKTRDEDPLLARELLDVEDDVADMEPVVYSPTFLTGVLRGQEDLDALSDRVREAYDAVAADRDLVILEGGGGFAVGGAAGLADGDVVDLLDARAVLVATYAEPGDVDRVFSAARHFGDRLAGVLFNAVPDAAIDELTADVVPFLERRGIETFGVLPRVQELAGVTVAELAEDLGADVATGAVSTDAYLERFVVGAMGPDEALRQFRRTRDAVMITGGDRSEIQTAALEAPGVRCLLLTGGFRPPGAVLGRAEEAGVPVLVVNTDTATAVERVEGVLGGGRTRDARTVERTGELLADGADVDGLLALARTSGGHDATDE